MSYSANSNNGNLNIQSGVFYPPANNLNASYSSMNNQYNPNFPQQNPGFTPTPNPNPNQSYNTNFNPFDILGKRI
jgi:hypothetical protein